MNLSFKIDNTSALQYYQLLRFSVLILLGIVLVKAGYPAEEIAIYELFFFLSNFVSFAWVMGFKNGLLAYFNAQTTDQKPKLLFNVAVLYLVFALIFGALLYLFRDSVAHLFLDRESIPNLMLILLYLVLNSPTVLNELFLLLHDRPKEIMRYGSGIFLLQLAGVATLAFLQISLTSILIFMVLWAFAKLIYTIVILFRFARFQFDWTIIRPFLWFSLPLCMHMLVGNGMEFVDGFLVTSHFDQASFAIFRYGARELPIVTIWVGALTSAMIPLAVKDYHSGLGELRSKVSRLIHWLFPLSALLMLLSPFLFEWVYSEEFLASANIFNIYLLILTNRIILVQVVLFSKHANRVLLFSGIVELILNIGLSLWLMQYFGLAGIAGATVIAYFVNKIILFLYSKQRYQLKLSDILPVRAYVLWSMVLIFCFIISMQYGWVL